MTTTLAMHMSDGLLNAPTSLLFGGVAIAGVGLALVRARADLDDRTAPMAGLVAAFVFAAQMINFPVLPGVSGHLLGGALAAILAGPWVGALCVSIVLVVQALLFADGGITMLGANITNMALIGTATGYLVALALRRLAVRSRAGLLVTAFAAAFVNTVAASCGFVLEYAIGGAAGYGTGAAALAVIGVHCLIGIGEGIITAATVGAVAAARPDLVHLLRTARPRAVEEKAR
ncbi:cobalt/nickel transport system permease protein [Saccharopolyspora erythraea NRRL 2338]|uniref:Cobalamin (Vitamin B12) biosynthesis CbiM protein n=2 Tax=Saccharopolyspora erythraea TaxID=1836 RepID=A4FGD6_SACEN|nr:energy-coupling factor ABC transporter permease [Saccharopolyspora erythraea]EQD84886.1 cobalamin biosynthesis protein CbiM [Saccharopolyspora erythraea D]PFG96815.1 cobalt/nickel transport system permease protein [Saccharopolyspora erythraea NRRL 2338]QRK87055.1 energy-coupling factor ABC transporter permease [Saccharopolyspora erythraea]CAM03111.1 cobalamin (vitamin B12) biosynthesis CbiM protein [Saccharopolyspora erythraea NRRL 2338]